MKPFQESRRHEETERQVAEPRAEIERLEAERGPSFSLSWRRPLARVAAARAVVQRTAFVALSLRSQPPGARQTPKDGRARALG